ncbi:MAG: zinc ribbon domain-containing protein [Promethearchaeota archaeon]
MLKKFRKSTNDFKNRLFSLIPDRKQNPDSPHRLSNDLLNKFQKITNKMVRTAIINPTDNFIFLPQSNKLKTKFYDYINIKKLSGSKLKERFFRCCNETGYNIYRQYRMNEQFLTFLSEYFLNYFFNNDNTTNSNAYRDIFNSNFPENSDNFLANLQHKLFNIQKTMRSAIKHFKKLKLSDELKYDLQEHENFLTSFGFHIDNPNKAILKQILGFLNYIPFTNYYLENQCKHIRNLIFKHFKINENYRTPIIKIINNIFSNENQIQIFSDINNLINDDDNIDDFFDFTFNSLFTKFYGKFRRSVRRVCQKLIQFGQEFCKIEKNKLKIEKNKLKIEKNKLIKMELLKRDLEIKILGLNSKLKNLIPNEILTILENLDSNFDFNSDNLNDIIKFWKFIMRDSVWKKLFYKNGVIYSRLNKQILNFYNTYNLFVVLKKQIKNLIKNKNKIENTENFINQMINYSFKNINMGFSISSNDINHEFGEFFNKKLHFSIYKYVKNNIIKNSKNLIKGFLNSVKNTAKNYIKIPNFRSIHINLGSGGDTIYELIYDKNNIHYYPDGSVSVIDKNLSVSVKLSFFERRFWYYKLKHPYRFWEQISAGYSPKRGSVTNLLYGRSIALNIPFQKETPDEAPDDKGLDNNSNDNKIHSSENEKSFITTGGIDLGLKTFGAISISHVNTGNRNIESIFGLADLFNRNFENIKNNGNENNTIQNRTRISNNILEIARFFLDQKQFFGPANSWWWKKNNLSENTNENEKEFLNNHNHFARGGLKNQLILLDQQIRELRSIKSKCKNKCKNRHRNYKNSREYFHISRKLNEANRKRKNIHLEIAKQVAVRFVALCKSYKVNYVLLEDLSWSKHSPKWKVGQYLAQNQIHWFFSKIQTLIEIFAFRSGIEVLYINPRHTSTRCSKCGYQDRNNRDGKVFKCLCCGHIKDSDLNASRNFPQSPLSEIKHPKLYNYNPAPAPAPPTPVVS